MFCRTKRELGERISASQTHDRANDSARAFMAGSGRWPRFQDPTAGKLKGYHKLH